MSLTALSSGAGINLVQRDLFALSPRTEQQRWLRSDALENTKHNSRIAMDDHRTNQQPVPSGILRCRRVLASDYVRQFRALRTSQCRRDRGIGRCRVCTCRPDLHDARNGSALWRAGENPQQFAARRLGSTGAIVSRSRPRAAGDIRHQHTASHRLSSIADCPALATRQLPSPAQVGGLDCPSTSGSKLTQRSADIR